MKFCVRCGRRLSNEEQFCTGCGMKQPYVPPELLFQNPAIQNRENAQTPFAVPCTALVPVNVPVEKTGVVAYLVWSLILFVMFNPIGTPLAMISALLCITANAQGCEAEKRDRRIGTAAVLCIVATVVDVFTLFVLATAALRFR